VSFEDDKRSGRPSASITTENVEKIWEHVDEDRRRAIHEFTDTAGINYGVFQEIFAENLKMHHIAPSSRQCARPHILENHRVCD
jgi:hypothetical protein